MGTEEEKKKKAKTAEGRHHLMGMEFAPLNVPWERRKQTIGAIYHVFVAMFFPFLSIGMFIYFFFFGYLHLVLLYGVWLWWDYSSPWQGSYASRWFQNMRVHRWFCEYFPMRMHTTAELPADKNYLIGIHPHGIYVMSSHHFISNGTGLMDRYPNIDFHLCTLISQFYPPLRREYLCLHGLINASKESLQYVLGGRKKGQAAVLVVGGAEEALDAHPGRQVLTLNRRKGFIKVALTTGASLIPCFAFGENDLYVQVDNDEGSPLRMVQTAFKNLTGYTPPIFHGRGVMNYTFGFLPFRQPLNTVLGAPIDVEKCENPTNEQIEELHSRYVERLTELFNENKDKFGVPSDSKLVIH